MPPEPTLTFKTSQQQHLHQNDLRWDWAVGRDRPPLRERHDFAHEFERWYEQHRTTHPCIVALNANNQVVRFGFVAITPRVPAANLHNDRAAAEIQALFVAPISATTASEQNSSTTSSTSQEHEEPSGSPSIPAQAPSPPTTPQGSPTTP